MVIACVYRCYESSNINPELIAVTDGEFHTSCSCSEKLRFFFFKNMCILQSVSVHTFGNVVTKIDMEQCVLIVRGMHRQWSSFSTHLYFTLDAFVVKFVFWSSTILMQRSSHAGWTLHDLSAASKLYLTHAPVSLTLEHLMMLECQ